MKILLLNQFFYPDTSATSQLLTDLSRGLVDSRDDVTVICSNKGYVLSTDGQPAPSVRVVRVRSLRFARGRLGRVVSYASFYMLAAWHSLFLPRQDVVVTMTTPPLLSLIGTILKKLRGTSHVIWEMDVYPDVAVALGYFKAGGALDRTIGALADVSRRNADNIIALAECMKSLLIKRGIPPEKICVAHNWSDSTAIKPRDLPSQPGALIVLYSGNLGLAHDVETVEQCIITLRNDPRITFIFAGGGARSRNLQTLVEKYSLANVLFRPHVAREDLGASLASGDIGLVTQREACCGAVVPSKVYGLLAAGRPFIFVGPAAAAPARIIEMFACGWHVLPGEPELLVAILVRLKTNHDEVRLASSSARRAALEHFSLPQGVCRIINIVKAGGKACSPSDQLSEMTSAVYEQAG